MDKILIKLRQASKASSCLLESVKKIARELESITRAQETEVQQSKSGESYDKIDRFLRNNLGDEEYSLYSKALDDVFSGRGEPVGYIHPANEHRLYSGETIAFRQRPYDGERKIPVYLDPQPSGSNLSTSTHSGKGPFTSGADLVNSIIGEQCGPVKVSNKSLQSLKRDLLTASDLLENRNRTLSERLFEHVQSVRALLDHNGREATIPEGWQLVPKVPTHEMIKALWETITENYETTDGGYAAMLKATPEFGEEE